MVLMNVSKKFIEKHFENVGGEPDGERPYANWVDYLTSGPVVAMTLEGREAAKKINELASNREQAFFWSPDGPTVYISCSARHANQDIQTWFGKDCEANDRSHLVHLLAEGKTRGALGRIYNTLENDPYYGMLKKRDLHAYFLKERMSFLVIKPKAFETRCVGEILSAFEYNSYVVRGLKLVKKSECPDSIVWSDSYGLTIWTDPKCQHTFGKMFEPTLIGLNREE